MRITTELLQSQSFGPLECIEYLDLSGRGIASIERLECCPRLETLKLNNNNLQEVYHLECCPRLWHLDLSNNQVVCLDGLSRFLALGTLVLSNNNLSWKDLLKIRHIHILSLSLHGNQQMEKNPYYRIHVIDCLPNIWMLDGRIITSAERIQVKAFFQDSALTDRPVRHMLSKEWFFPSNLQKIQVNGIFGEKAKHMMIRFPANALHNIEIDQRRLKYLAYIIQEDLVLEKTYTQKEISVFKYKKTFLEDLLHDRPDEREKCNMLLILLVASLEFQMPALLMKDTLDTAKLYRFGQMFTIDLFLLPRNARCLVVSILLGALKIDRDNHEDGGLYDELYLCIFYLVTNLMKLSQSDQKKALTDKSKSSKLYCNYKCLLASEVVQMLCIVPSFLRYLEEDVAGVRNLVITGTGDPNSVETVLKLAAMYREQQKDSASLYEGVYETLLQKVQERARNITNKTHTKGNNSLELFTSKALPMKGYRTIAEIAEYHTLGVSSPDYDPDCLQPTTRSCYKNIKRFPHLGDAVLLGPQTIGKIISLPQPFLALVGMDTVPVPNGAMEFRLKDSGDHYTYLNMEQFEWSTHCCRWRPLGTVGDRYTIQSIADFEYDLLKRAEIWEHFGCPNSPVPSDALESGALMYTPRQQSAASTRSVKHKVRPQSLKVQQVQKEQELKQEIKPQQQPKEQLEETLQETSKEQKSQEELKEQKSQKGEEKSQSDLKEQNSQEEQPKEQQEEQGEQPQDEPEKQGSQDEPEKRGSQDEPEKPKSQDEPEKQGSQDELDKKKSQDELEKQGSQNELDKPKSQDELEKQGSQDELDKKKSQDELDKKKSLDEPEKQGSQDELDKKKSQDELEKQGSQDELDKQKSQDEPEKQGSQDEPEKQGSQDEPEKQGSQDELDKKKSQDELEKQQSQNELEKKQSRDGLEKQQSQEGLDKEQSQDEVLKQSPDEQGKEEEEGAHEKHSELEDEHTDGEPQGKGDEHQEHDKQQTQESGDRDENQPQASEEAEKQEQPQSSISRESLKQSKSGSIPFNSQDRLSDPTARSNSLEEKQLASVLKQKLDLKLDMATRSKSATIILNGPSWSNESAKGENPIELSKNNSAIMCDCEDFSGNHIERTSRPMQISALKPQRRITLPADAEDDKAWSSEDEDLQKLASQQSRSVTAKYYSRPGTGKGSNSVTSWSQRTQSAASGNRGGNCRTCLESSSSHNIQLAIQMPSILDNASEQTTVRSVTTPKPSARPTEPGMQIRGSAKNITRVVSGRRPIPVKGRPFSAAAAYRYFVADKNSQQESVFNTDFQHSRTEAWKKTARMSASASPLYRTVNPPPPQRPTSPVNKSVPKTSAQDARDQDRQLAGGRT
ncbi:uncharacterized protein LOC121374191 [Gigantopelta aegis]|uniref:uncharacterized protein LOC121374191 n=1 Tax=Gigantopelta aegis TaxID=1735272 RepID=UPI001B8889BD|nr:uncharacterized protein LOC121374191 [Gigantopelta aegis]